MQQMGDFYDKLHLQCNFLNFGAADRGMKIFVCAVRSVLTLCDDREKVSKYVHQKLKSSTTPL